MKSANRFSTRITPMFFRLNTIGLLSAITTASLFGAANASAKDLYVATNGSNGVSYAANSQSSPWGTIDYAIDNMQGGDTLYVRAGTYVAGSKHYPTVSGSSGSPTTITSFPGELATIDLGNIGLEWIGLDGVDYWEISELQFVNVQVIVTFAQTFPSRNHVIRNNRIVANRGGDNTGPIRLQPNASFIVIDGNEIIGAGRKADGTNHNTSCTYMERVSNVTVINNRLSNCVVGIHYKHSIANNGGSNIEYAYNYITGTDDALRYNGNNGFIHDNIFGPDSNLGTIGADNGGPGGYYNIFEHNTFAGGTLSLTDAGPMGAVQGNVVRNNIFVPWSLYQNLDIVRWTTSSHNTTLDYNLHPPTNEAVHEYQVAYTLPQWRAYYGGSANSIEGTPVFQGGNNPVTIDDFRLTPTSPGAGAASDGTDMGARIDLFGASGLGIVRPEAPTALSVN